MEGINVEKGISNAGNEELFYSLLGDFYVTIDRKIAKIESCILENRLRDYTIEVHALKSAARLIGATELGDEFYQLELLGDAGNTELIEKETPVALKHLRSYKEILKSYVETAEEDKQDMNVPAVTALLQDMIRAVDSFDLDGTDAIMKQLDSYRFPESCLEDLKNLRVYVADVAMEEIMETCKVMENWLTGETV